MITSNCFVHDTAMSRYDFDEKSFTQKSSLEHGTTKKFYSAKAISDRYVSSFFTDAQKAFVILL